jgi:pimeloyl-ACP methyl ester carboxylesterase
MISNNSDRLVIFIPGILGSTLIRFGTGVGKADPLESEVWSADARKTLQIIMNKSYLLESPGSLSYTSRPTQRPYIQPGEVIQTLTGFGNRDVYGEFLAFLRNKLADRLFFPFPYDWRLDNRQSARLLAEFINKVDPLKKASIQIIAHSMGGIIARLMLIDNKSISDRTNLLFQIASPILGSSKAFYSLKEKIRINAIADKYIEWFQDKREFHYLQNVIMGFPSLYQLLPPLDEKILYNDIGQQFSACDPVVWPKEYRQYVLDAQEVHKKLRKPLSNNIQCVYSDEHITEMYYKVDAGFRYAGTPMSQPVYGDGTVTGSSAIAGSQFESCHLFRGGALSVHDQLPKHNKVLSLLEGFLS